MKNHTNEWNRFVIQCNDFYEAARYAAELGLWLHCWSFEEKDCEAKIIDTWF